MQVLVANTRIRDLDVSDNKIGDTAACALAQNPSIKKLKVRCCRMGETGLFALAASEKITHLDISCYDRLSEEVVITLANNPTITDLRIIKCGMENPTLATLPIMRITSLNKFLREGLSTVLVHRLERKQRPDLPFYQVFLTPKKDNLLVEILLWVSLQTIPYLKEIYWQ